VWDRLGVAGRMVDKGVIWKVGKIFIGREMLHQFGLLPGDGHKMPAFINLQQYYAEAYLVDRGQELPKIDLRWLNKVTGLERPTLADICIVPQVFNAKRFGVDVSPYKRIAAIDFAASKLAAFTDAEPDRQTDAE
jgi:glutathione S-transferase